MILILIKKWQKELETAGFIDHQKGLLIRQFIKDLKKLDKIKIKQINLF